ncbi:MAG TPA: leucyl/phenylalanyl-tRNA--protein transferase [Candidatus Avipropionibacterium avicola]|uniref:Leucyl/phenylalanyl-tRNA--protein transferase n=1 Tax=Candidatus Avipropionibacterium avicola TaxID=2840701 RepID=A0A9D1H0X4_9ACTN|nr:leucyl/phenylalanyl-tRNA--protein transferase [Candidatus Avipropionibacterium avicola]
MPSSIFGDPEEWPPQDPIGLSEDLTLPLVVEGYRSGVFPMPVPRELPHGIRFAWFCPPQRGILPLTNLRITRSLRKTAKRYRVSVDRRFTEVMTRCADPSRDGSWITDEIVAVYAGLHERGLAHSVEVWDDHDRLVGGLYGVGLGGLFAGESMFHDPEHGRDASKVALIRLVELLTEAGGERLLDVQWSTPHLASLGVVEVDRADYLARLDRVLPVSPPMWDSTRLWRYS